MRKFINILRFNIKNYCQTSYFYRNKITPAIFSSPQCVANNTNVNTMKSRFSTMASSEKVSINDIKELSEEFPIPKQIMQRVILEAFFVNEDHSIEPVMNVVQIPSATNESRVWHATLTMKWPENFQVEGLSQKKSDAERIAYLLACQKLKEYGHLNSHNDPVVPKLQNDNELHVAKSTLCNIFNKIWPKLGNRKFIPEFETTQETGIFNSKNVWRTKLTLKYPELKTFSAFARKLGDAEQIASLKALSWLLEKGIINHKNQFIAFSRKEQEEMIAMQNIPCPLQIPDYMREEMGDVLNNYSNWKQNQRTLLSDNVIQEEDNTLNIIDSTPINILTENPYIPLTEEEAHIRNTELNQRLESVQNTNNPELLEIQKDRFNLPIAQRRDDIVNLIRNNQVVVLSGETGCGKTTQVPQYILDSFITDSKGSQCNIVVTQPRRISAMSIAERVATERGEPVGQTIGYQVRLNKCLPNHDHGGILFCSTGMLLRKLCYNPNLTGISHVIVDEIHERSMQIDFLLILLKELLEQNQTVKLVLMSASFNTRLFSEYFDRCPVIHIPGKIYPVKEYFLEDISRKIDCSKSFSPRSKLDVKLLTSIIKHADNVEPPGAILCFLPGWNEISSVANELSQIFSDNEKYFIYKLHSKLLPEEQKKVFIRPPNGVRKIVLSTNVAECSITINDIVCVIDSGFQKGTSFDNYSGTASLGLQWITKANVRQRRGRAGRVQPGTCYYAYPRNAFMDMIDYPIPEMHRMSLEKVVLDCKLYCPNTKAQEFLSLALQPPSKLSIQMGIHDLTMMGILDQNENLTTLGKSIVNFATHPRLSKALVTATFLRCLDPILTIAAFLTFHQSPFCDSLEKASDIKKIKKIYDQSKFSDHLALYNLYCKWDSMNDDEDSTHRSNFVNETLMDEDSLIFIKKLKGLFAENLLETGFIDNVNDAFNLSNVLNQNSTNTEMVLAALSSGFYPNVIKVQQGEVSRGNLHKDVVTYSTINDQAATLQQDSIVSKEYNLPSPWLVYFSTLKSEARMTLLMPLVSCTPGICHLLFSGRELVLKTKTEPESISANKVTLLVDEYEKLRFSCLEEEGKLILDWRQDLREMFQTYLNIVNQKDGEKQIVLQNFIDTEVLPILREVLKLPQIPFTKGRRYTLSEGEIISHDL